MKSKLIFIIFLSMFALVSCKDKEVQNENNEVAPFEQVQKDNIIVTLTAVVKKDDSFQLYYKNEDSEAFSEEKSFFIEFKGSETEQNIVFNLPEEEFPNYLRMDFGTNKEQSPIEIKNLKLSYYDKTVEIKDSNFFDYFYGNELTVKIDKQNAIVEPLLSAEGNYDPMFASADGLRKQLEQLVQQQ
jgi:hypothetical protein